MNEDHGKDFPYLFNPENGRVMINSEHKRKVCPKLVPCESLDGPPGYETLVSTGKQKPVKGEEVPPDSSMEEAAGPEDLLAEVEASEDLEFVKDVASQLGVQIHPRNNLKGAKKRVRKAVNDLLSGKEPEEE
jgi:hypothetical protein